MKNARKPKRAAKKSKRSAKIAMQSDNGAREVDAYIAAAPEPARGMLKQLRAAMRSVVPAGTTETISYRIPAFKHKKVLVWYAAFSEHCSLFPTSRPIAAFKDELKNFTTSKGTIHFPLDRPLPIPLIKKIVKFRIAQMA